MTVYLNWNGPNGKETVDEFTKGEDAPGEYRKFLQYVREMAGEYRLAGMHVYRSSRPCAAWRDR